LALGIIPLGELVFPERDYSLEDPSSFGKKDAEGSV
jgi:hypothetical protein